MHFYVKLGAAALLTSALTAPAAWAGETLDRVMSSKTLTMSSDAEYPPQSFLNDSNQMDGFDVDVGPLFQTPAEVAHTTSSPTPPARRTASRRSRRSATTRSGSSTA